MLAQGFLRVKGQAKIKMLLFVSWRNKYAIIEWPLFDAPTSTHGVFTSFRLSGFCCLHFCRIKVGLILAQGYFTGQRSSKHYSQIATFYDSVWYAVVEWPLFDAPSSTHGVFTSLLYLSAVAYISVEISLGSCWYGDILRVKGQEFITNCNFLWLCVITSSGNYSTRHYCTHGVFTSFNLSKCCYLHFWRKKFGSMLAQGYFKG